MSIFVQSGTRQKVGLSFSHPPEAGITRSMSADPGLDKLATASMSFSASTNKITAANGTFANFAVNDIVVIESTNLNNGFQTVTAIDGTNQSFLTVDQGLHTEGPLTATVRTL